MNKIKSRNSKAASSLPEENFVHSVNSVSRKLVLSLLDWFSKNARDLPWRKMKDPYAIWVSEIMLQQTQVKTVIPYFERWLGELPTIESLAQAPSERIHKLWEGLGYYTRVRNLQKAAQVICEKYKRRFPENFDDVLSLPGIGRYTAGAICSIAFDQPTPILDGNVIRVLTRVFGIADNPKEKKTNEQLWKLAAELVQISADQKSKIKNQKFPCSSLNQSLMELGALICTPRQPKCEACPIQKFCVARRENRVEQLPNLGERTSATARRFVAFVVEKNGRFLVHQRPAGIVNAHLWEFPNVEVGLKDDWQKIKGQLAVEVSPKPLCRIKHSITRYRITLEAFRGELPKDFAKNKSATRWCSLEELKALPFPSAHKKIVSHLRSESD